MSIVLLVALLLIKEVTGLFVCKEKVGKYKI